MQNIVLITPGSGRGAGAGATGRKEAGQGQRGRVEAGEGPRLEGGMPDPQLLPWHCMSLPVTQAMETADVIQYLSGGGSCPCSSLLR